MAKINWKPGTMLYPVPAVLVTCGTAQDGYNIITIAWTGTVCSDPPMCSISIRPERYSYDIISKNKEFVINLTTAALARATDWCGVKSGRDVDKFKTLGLTPVKAQKVKAPLIEESPLSIECRVRQVLPLGSHHMFLAEVAAIDADEALINPRTGAFMLSRARPICYLHGRYFALGKLIGTFGYSVRKRKAGTRPAKGGRKRAKVTSELKLQVTKVTSG
jgi:flavin reductase (DIM6/NTAB) family NADH-FMN oxidoreductase RutF